MTVSVFLIGLGLIVAVAAGFFLTRVGAVQAWREEAEAQKARGDRLERDLNDIRDRVMVLEHDNAQLKELASGASAIASMAEALSRNHTETMAAIVGISAMHN